MHYLPSPKVSKDQLFTTVGKKSSDHRHISFVLIIKELLSEQLVSKLNSEVRTNCQFQLRLHVDTSWIFPDVLIEQSRTKFKNAPELMKQITQERNKGMEAMHEKL